MVGERSINRADFRGSKSSMDGWGRWLISGLNYGQYKRRYYGGKRDGSRLGKDARTGSGTILKEIGSVLEPEKREPPKRS